MLAFEAAKRRASMAPSRRELARKRWKWACRKVISPASKMKRAMANMLDQKVDVTLTVVSRVEVLEKYIQKLESELHNTKKSLLSQMKGKVKNADEEQRNQKEETADWLKYLHREQHKMNYKWGEYMESILGTKTHLATQMVNTSQNTNSRPPIASNEPTHLDRVVKTLSIAANTVSENLAKKLSKLAVDLKMGEQDDNFDGNAVAFELFNLLHEHSEELGNNHHITKRCEDSEHFDSVALAHDHEGARNTVTKYRNSIWGDKIDNTVASNENGMSLKDLLRLELFKLASQMSLTNDGNSSADKKVSDMAQFLENEIERLEKKSASDIKDKLR